MPNRPKSHEAPLHDEVALALREVARAIDRNTTQREGADKLLTDVAHRCDGFWKFVMAHRMKLALSVPTVFTVIGALSPNAAGLLGVLIRTLAAHMGVSLQ